MEMEEEEETVTKEEENVTERLEIEIAKRKEHIRLLEQQIAKDAADRKRKIELLKTATARERNASMKAQHEQDAFESQPTKVRTIPARERRSSVHVSLTKSMVLWLILRVC
ncbi:hypothetical protein BT69DRAFT_716107 [Atractiella rhizophila]|nr:hypothetical protein BT69DRAFT_716107 [Atractiella rhizophila]